MINFLRRYKKPFFLILDAIIIFLAAWFSFLIRFDDKIPDEYLRSLYSLIILSLFFSLPIFYWQKLYHFTWRFVGLNDFYQIIKSVTFANILVAAALFIFRDISPFSGFPRSVVLINYFIDLLGIGILRIGKRLLVETIQNLDKSGRRILIIGAGEAGEELARSVIRTKGYNLIGFVDDGKNKQNTFIHGCQVLGTREDLGEIVKKLNIEEVIIAFPSVEPQIIKETLEICREANLSHVKILPSTREILSGKATLANVRDISIEDLLGREKVQIDTDAINDFLARKRVLVTGAAGSIGSHLCEQILKFKPESLIAIDQNETGIFHLERNLEKLFPGIKKHFIIADICDESKIDWIFGNRQPQIIFHAAAYKHVPVMEIHPEEAAKNNVFGTLNLGQMAIKHGVDKFVTISTDKAINPTSVMGVSKRISELVCQYLNKKRQTKFYAVRFGNVLDSQGNVVGIFEEQIKKGGPVEITHPEMKRYFMITAEACLLVMQAGAIGKGGEVFVLDMGVPIKIIDLAKEMIKLAGYEPDVEIPIVFTGMRPGEKLFEEMMLKEEIPTKNQKIFIAKLGGLNEEELKKSLEDLRSAVNRVDREQIINIFKELVSEYQK